MKADHQRPKQIAVGFVTVLVVLCVLAILEHWFVPIYRARWENCEAFANFVFDVQRRRDDGVPLDTVLNDPRAGNPRVRAIIRGVYADKASRLKDRNGITDSCFWM